jgi:hypothetical protein
MAQLAFRTADNTNHNGFVPGDSVIKSTTLLGAIYECKTRLLLAIKAYNRQNADLPIPEPEVASDDNDGSNTLTMSLPYRRVGATKRSLAYFADYSDWVVPTTGELTGFTNIADAFFYLIDSADQVLQEMTPNAFLADPKGLITISDDNNSRAVNYSLPFDLIIDSATGVESRKPVNGLIFYDLAQDNPII